MGQRQLTWIPILADDQLALSWNVLVQMFAIMELSADTQDAIDLASKRSRLTHAGGSTESVSSSHSGKFIFNVLSTIHHLDIIL